MEASYHGAFKEQASAHNNWLPVPEKNVPRPSPAAVSESNSDWEASVLTLSAQVRGMVAVWSPTRQGVVTKAPNPKALTSLQGWRTQENQEIGHLVFPSGNLVATQEFTFESVPRVWAYICNSWMEIQVEISIKIMTTQLCSLLYLFAIFLLINSTVAVDGLLGSNLPQ